MMSHFVDSPLYN